MKDQPIATVFGGTGFIGSQIVRGLAKQGYIIKVATRVPERAYDLKPCGMVGQVVPFACNYFDEVSIRAAVKGSDVVVNCIGIIVKRGRNTFRRVNVEIPRLIAEACAAQGVQRFVHISALSADQGRSAYARSKLEGEQAAREAFPAASILRPSIVFGPDDHFFNMFAELARFTPVLPLIGGGHTKFQPVYVGDVADAAIACLTLPDTGVHSPLGRTYELGGPEVFTFRQIYEHMFRVTGRRRTLLTLPWGIAKVQAGFLSLLPHPPLTPDQVESLKTDVVVAQGAAGFPHLGIEPVAMDMILPDYLDRFRPGGRFGDKKKGVS